MILYIKKLFQQKLNMIMQYQKIKTKKINTKIIIPKINGKVKYSHYLHDFIGKQNLFLPYKDKKVKRVHSTVKLH